MRSTIRGWLVLGSALALGALALPGCKPAGPPPSSSVSAASATNAPAAAALSAAQIEKLKGKWFRTDGNYLIEIEAIAPDGSVTAGYFNPGPIRVEQAEAKAEGAALKVRLTLRDVNYPGCRYDLTYLPGQEQLVGTYFQAALQEMFEVAFVRAPQ